MHGDPPEPSGYVGVDRKTISRVARAAEEARARSEGLRHATQALLTLADDFRIDAVRRLRERGASEAQVEGYERAYQEARNDALSASRARENADAELLESVRALVDGDRS